MTIKLLLIVGLLGFAFYAFRARVSPSHLAMRRVLTVIVVMLGILAVLFPSVTNWAAEQVGVTRGADLLTYAFVVVSLFVWVGLYRRIMELEDRLITLSRRMALASTEKSAADTDAGRNSL